MANTRTFTSLEVRRLLRRAFIGTLATLNRDGGTPYASLANVATDVDGHPIIMVSALAWHTRNLLADGRASFLAAERPESGDALTGARVTVMGQFQKIETPRIARRYLAVHPEARGYASFGDFSFWRLEPELIHAVAGFGRIETLPPSEVFPTMLELAAIEESAIVHMNGDHSGAVQRFAARLGGAAHGRWKVAAIDGDGAVLSDEKQSLRLEFPEPVHDGTALRRVFAALAKGQ